MPNYSDETKQLDMDWESKVENCVDPLEIRFVLKDIDKRILYCIDEIENAGLGGISYTSQANEIDRVTDAIQCMNKYVSKLREALNSQIDTPLYEAFNKKATETLSRVHPENLETNNIGSFEEKDCKFISATHEAANLIYGNNGMYIEGITPDRGYHYKGRLTLYDFLGYNNADGKYLDKTGYMTEFADMFKGDYDLLVKDGNLKNSNIKSLDEYLDNIIKGANYDHKMDQPFKSLISGVLDLTIIKPIIEACSGTDMVTGEDLTGVERGMKAVFAVVDVVTLGNAVVAIKGMEIGGKEALVLAGKTIAVNAVSNTASYAVGYIGEKADLPPAVTIALSLCSGITVSKVAGKYIFKNAAGTVIRKTTKANAAKGAGDYQELLKQSTCNTDDFYKYLNKINSDYADTYVKTGKWPSDVQIPKSPDVLKIDGSVNWNEVPNGGYILDGNGDAIKEQYVPSIGETIDRHGPDNGRFTSPIRNNKPYSYTQRSLPYMENPSQYHRYKVTGDFSNIERYFNQSTDVNLKRMISAYMKKFRLSFSNLETYQGKIASGFGEIGGGEQYELPLPVNMLEGLGLLKEF